MKKTINKMKMQPTKWEKIFANDMSNKGLISKLYEELIQRSIKNKQTIGFKNGQRTQIGIFLKKIYK